MLVKSYKNMLLGLGVFMASCSPNQEHSVSMDFLMANFEKYSGRKVSTYGYIAVDHDIKLYLNREQSLRHDRAQFLEITPLSDAETSKLKVCNNQYVSVVVTVVQGESNQALFLLKRIKSGADNNYSAYMCNLTFD